MAQEWWEKGEDMPIGGVDEEGNKYGPDVQQRGRYPSFKDDYTNKPWGEVAVEGMAALPGSVVGQFKNIWETPPNS